MALQVACIALQMYFYVYRGGTKVQVMRHLSPPHLSWNCYVPICCSYGCMVQSDIGWYRGGVDNYYHCMSYLQLHQVRGHTIAPWARNQLSPVADRVGGCNLDLSTWTPKAYKLLSSDPQCGQRTPFVLVGLRFTYGVLSTRWSFAWARLLPFMNILWF